MQRLEHVASIRLAQQALANMQLEKVINRDVTEDEKVRRRQRIRACKHVIETGTIYEPILEPYRDQ